VFAVDAARGRLPPISERKLLVEAVAAEPPSGTDMGGSAVARRASRPRRSIFERICRNSVARAERAHTARRRRGARRTPTVGYEPVA
jgi:hypothetical protein